MPPTVQILIGDVMEKLRELPGESVQCVVTSPPYWGLRDYGGQPGQIGREATFAEWLEKMIYVFQRLRVVLRKDGIVWVNMGDSYVSESTKGTSLYPKNLVGQPWRLALALQGMGWWLRRDVIWEKPNAMPESCTDRPATSHEYVFMFACSERYFYNQAEARDPVTGGAHARGQGKNPKCAGFVDGPGKHTPQAHAQEHKTGSTKFPRPRQNASFSPSVSELVSERNYRSVWTIPTQPFAGPHFATFPEALVRRCILAGTTIGQTVLDPFAGSGTTGRVALSLGRSAVLIELNPDYLPMIRERIHVTSGLPLSFP